MNLAPYPVGSVCRRKVASISIWRRFMEPAHTPSVLGLSHFFSLLYFFENHFFFFAKGLTIYVRWITSVTTCHIDNDVIVVPRFCYDGLWSFSSVSVPGFLPHELDDKEEHFDNLPCKERFMVSRFSPF